MRLSTPDSVLAVICLTPGLGWQRLTYRLLTCFVVVAAMRPNLTARPTHLALDCTLA
jgi:hypothetical protein